MTVRALLVVSSTLLVACGGSSATRSAGRTTAAVTSGSGTASAGSGTASAGSGTASAGSGTATTTSSTPPHYAAVAFETLDVGPSSPRGVAQGAHTTHVGRAADWASFWATHSAAPLPRVDFGQACVVGTFMPQVPGSEPFTRVIGVERDAHSDDLRVLVREHRRGAWRPVVRVLVSPFHLVRCQTAVSGRGQVGVVTQTALDFEVAAAGSNAALGANDPTYTGGLRVFRDAAAFQAFYAQLQPGVRPPAIDFRSELAVAVLGPYVASFGNRVETLRLVHDPRTDEIRARTRIVPYSGGAAPPPATETPFQIVRASLSSGTIRAEREGPARLSPLASGDSPLYRGPAETLVIRDATTLASVWSARIGQRPPAVDFTRQQVLLAFGAVGSGREVRVARAVALEDDELAVSVHTLLRGGLSGASWSAVTTARTLGPVGFEVRDVTPRP